MQLGGIGNDHSSSVHHVTNCMHDHGNSLEGKIKLSSGPVTASQQFVQAQQDQTAQFSLIDWVQRLLRSTGNRILGFWQGNDGASTGQAGDKSDGTQTMAQAHQISDMGVINNQNQARQAQLLQQNPYFATVAEDASRPAPLTLGKRIRMKCRGVASQLADHLPGRFLGSFRFDKNGSFHARKEGTKEDLRRRSKYREDTLELDCVITDESYLLDSYDRKGEYSQLTTKK